MIQGFINKDTIRNLGNIGEEQANNNSDIFFNTFIDIIFVLDIEGNIIQMNNTAYQQLKYAQEELTQKSVLLLIPDNKRDEASKIILDMLPGKVQFHSIPLLTKDGIIIIAETRVFMGQWNGKRALFCVHKTGRGRSIKTIINSLHEKNRREEQHSYRVSVLCKSMGEALGLSEYENDELKLVGLLHDIGKIAIDEKILNKPGKLTINEWQEIKRHSEIGYRILNLVNDMSDMANYILYHHERWDGNGYPKGLKGDEIPFVSRIIAITDAYDAMTSARSYRRALPVEVAIVELQKNSGSQFDIELVSTFIKKVLI